MREIKKFLNYLLQDITLARMEIMLTQSNI